jgi:hypothetical protein
MKASKYFFASLVCLIAFILIQNGTPQLTLQKAEAFDLTVPVVSGQFPVLPGRFSVQTIRVTFPTMKLTGTFQAVGGKGNDIEVYVMDQNGYALWQRRNPAFGLYSSGRVSSGEINIDLPMGTYYIVFSNMFSNVSSKTVEADILLKTQ